MKMALLVVDMQNGLLENKKEQLNVNRASIFINYTAELLRSKNHVVVHIQDVEGATDLYDESVQIIPEITVEETDFKVTKTDSSAFWKTNLEQILLEREVELVIVAGFAAEQCVLFTYNGAMERGFKPVMLQNGILSTKSDVITSTYRDRDIVSCTAIEYIVNQ